MSLPPPPPPPSLSHSIFSRCLQIARARVSTYLLMLEPVHQRRGQVVKLVGKVSDAQQHFGLPRSVSIWRWRPAAEFCLSANKRSSSSARTKRQDDGHLLCKCSLPWLEKTASDSPLVLCSGLWKIPQRLCHNSLLCMLPTGAVSSFVLPPCSAVVPVVKLDYVLSEEFYSGRRRRCDDVSNCYRPPVSSTQLFISLLCHF